MSQEPVEYQSDESLPAVLRGMKRKAFLVQMKQHILLLLGGSS